MSCWVCDAANGTCEHKDGNVLTPELALEIERRDHADEMAEAKDEIKRLKGELRVTEHKLAVCRNDATMSGDLAAKRFERIKELEKELDEEEKEGLLALRNLDKALTEVDVWKRQSEAWQKRGWELGKEADALQGFAERAIRLVHRFRMDAWDRVEPWLEGETFPSAMADILETDWKTMLRIRELMKSTEEPI